MRILFSENLTFKFCGVFFLKVFLRLCFWIDCLLWTSNQKCHPCERCTKLADTKGKGHYSFLPGCGLQNMTLRNVQSPWKEKWRDIAEITRVQRIILRFFFFQAGGFGFQSAESCHVFWDCFGRDSFTFLYLAGGGREEYQNVPQAWGRGSISVIFLLRWH